MVTAEVSEQVPERQFNRRLTYYHPNGKGTGSAAQFELRLNRAGEQRYDCFFLEMAHQKTKAAGGGVGRQPATFDWENKVTVKLGFTDVCEFLMVLEGRRTEVGNGRNGLYHQSGDANTMVSLRASDDGPRYCLGVSRKRKDGEQLFKGHIVLTEVEVTGLRCVFQAGLFYMAFATSLHR